ncbi:glycosyltransferase family 2 protein [Marinibactrum halimedae]|uniref:Glycosyltransferase 2-like domain-containing protein n=1 Tax=Marinibactrum halimedae TaxID=1444977 RepID=A0AA37TE98_9GAMM|nr:glycosyltransferase family 2 protein [Marinibactrum halimedae]MCD9460437.1 glycosyltransferase family 2 protein [Marinibactrum halimedae]GLS27432.1 hypothetical protein GCM10007877_31510 [Marinibactrum halimedae]
MKSYHPCVIIPVYNHHLKIKDVVEVITSLGYPCIVLDDGSDKTCQQVLQSLAQTNQNVSLTRFDQNRGKGAVVCDGLAIAYEKGFTHALQVDADGQHDLNDLPLFMSLAEAHPCDVISGHRAYESLPANRRYGRMVTDVWVWIHTWSRQIKDSMCGYRLYPLAETMTLLKHYAVGRRMEFDTDILVRLYWSGLEIRHIPTQVEYDDDIASHFDLLNDNLRISWMHTRLFFGMLLRIPRLIIRKLR